MELSPKSHNDNSNESRVSSMGHRHTPTQRLSERKRSLFDGRNPSLESKDVVEDVEERDEYADLGPMSPLQYSSSCDEDAAHGVPFDRSVHQTSFLNMFPHAKDHQNHHEEVTISDLSSDFMVEDDDSQPIPLQTPWLFCEQSATDTLDSVRTEADERTPAEKMTNCQELRISFKKSLILGDLTPDVDVETKKKRPYSMSILGENNSDCVQPRSEKQMKMDSDPRARLSLTFDSIAIPTSRFYNSENVEPKKRFSAPALGSSGGGAFKTSEKRIKRRSGNGFGIRKGCGHKIKKPPTRAVKETVTQKVALAMAEDRQALDIDEAQSVRINHLLKNIKNPIEMSRPVLAPKAVDVETDDEVDEDREEPEENTKRKFFKSRNTGAKSYRLSNNVVATMKAGKMVLPPKAAAPSRKRSSGTGDTADTTVDFAATTEEFETETEEVTGIICKLTRDDEMDMFRARIPYNTTDPREIERQSDVLELLISHDICSEETFTIFIAEPEQHPEEMARILDDLVVVTESAPFADDANLYPIFYPKKNKKKVVSIGGGTLSAQAASSGCRGRRGIWKKIGQSQLQIDAGQKRFGATYCAECDLLYSVHEPEDELMHQAYHDSLSVLSFRGWKVEDVIRAVPDWGAMGRIIAVQATENKVKLHRVANILAMVNREMGAPAVDVKAKMIVYLAVAHNVVLGVCVAEPKYEANRMHSERGVDYFSEEIYPVRCGISRIWVAGPYRNQGVATQLVEAVRGHYIFGHYLTMDEVAFQSPTEAGKLLAIKLANRNNFLVYP